MRITTGMMTNRYLRSLNQSSSQMFDSNEKVFTGRKFSKGSEDPVSAIKAYKLRRDYRDTQMYDTNISDADSFLTIAETNLTQISSDLERVYTSYLKGVNGTMTSDDREIIAKELDNIQKSVLNSLNAKISDRYVFGGTSKDEIPFKVDDITGELLYKDVNVTSGDVAELKSLANEKIYIDLGLGMKFDGDTLNTDTVFDMSVAGIKFIGYGTNGKDTEGEEIPNNLYTLIGKIKDELRNPDFSFDKIKPYIENFETQKKQVLVGITDIGSKTKYIDFLKLKNEDNQYNINKKMLDIEFVDPAKAIIEFKSYEYSYNAALSMGNKILQNSFIDFMK